MMAVTTETLFGTASATARPLPRGLGAGRTVLAGGLVIAAFFGVFGTWAAVAPLESAAIAQGVVSVDGRRKTVQHLEGGLVSEILVDEGAVVEAGQPLVRLDVTQTRAMLGRLRNQFNATAALIARLEAERDSADRIAFPDWMSDDDPAVASVMAGQRTIFEARRTSLSNQQAILGQRAAELREEIAGLEAAIATQDRQLALIQEEIGGVARLVDQGLERRPRLLELQRGAAEIEGFRAQNQGDIARARQNIGEAELQAVEVATERMGEVVEDLRDAETQSGDLEEQIGAAEDVLRRTDIVAPVAGTVVNLRLFTPGAVIQPGDKLMDIVPSGEPFVIEARVEPTDIDVVHPGLPAQVRFSAFNHGSTPTFEGEVRQVSADRLVDERTGQPYYMAQVTVAAGEVGGDGLTLYPGMPAEVMIVTGQHTTLEYLLKPIRNTLSRGLREG